MILTRLRPQNEVFERASKESPKIVPNDGKNTIQQAVVARTRYVHRGKTFRQKIG